jgi:signal transduction histidine kinase
MVWNWLQRHPGLVDVVMTLGLAAIFMGRAARLESWPGVPLALLEVAPLLVRRRFPLPVLGVVAAATLVETLVYGSTLQLPAAVAVYTVAAHLDRRTSLRASAVSGAAIAVAAHTRSGFGGLVQTVLLLGIAWVIGDNLGTRRAYFRELELRADRLEREQQAQAARAVAEEQARIARELHDVIAHNVSVMVVHAAAGLDAFDDRPHRAREALETIEATGRSALGELRRLLGAVRDGDPDFEPQPDLSRLPSLLDQVRSSGVEVVLHNEGAPAEPLAAAIELSAYRVVQEALTNTLKHSLASRIDVRLRYSANELEVDVRDDGRATGNGTGTGSGLIGMRERLAAVGGTLSAGAAPGGGYAVKARFPL